MAQDAQPGSMEERDWHALTDEELFEEVQVDPSKGLSEQGAKNAWTGTGPTDFRWRKRPPYQDDVPYFFHFFR